MITLNFSQIANVLNAKLINARVDGLIETISTDSRKIEANGLFIALKGERFDAHDFALTAVDNGAKALLVERKLDIDIPQFVVDNSHQAMGTLAAFVREQVAPISVALTGSNGKTSVKEMVATILMQSHKVLYTAGNFNNDIGVPLTLFRLSHGDEYGVFELGANHKGEIDYTSGLVKPQVALVNNIGSAHLEGFGSIEGVAQAKSEIFNHISPNGTAIINADDSYAAFLRAKAKHVKQLSFSREANTQADVKANNITANAQGCYEFLLTFQGESSQVLLPLAGIHQVSNALAAASMCIALGLKIDEIAQGLNQLLPVKGRMQPISLGRFLLIDDSYNANPSSVSAAINWLAKREQHTVLVLGDLGELGDNAALLHGQVGEQAKLAGIDALFCQGMLSQHTSAAFGSKHFIEKNDLVSALVNHLNSLPNQVTVLVKGSRSAAMERVIDSLKQAFEGGELV